MPQSKVDMLKLKKAHFIDDDNHASDHDDLSDLKNQQIDHNHH